MSGKHAAVLPAFLRVASRVGEKTGGKIGNQMAPTNVYWGSLLCAPGSFT